MIASASSAACDELDRADDDALKRVAADRPPSPASRAASRASGRSAARGQAVARERPGQVAAALAEPSVQRGRVLDVLLDDVLVELGGRDVEPAVGDDPAAVDRVAVRVGERDELGVELDVGERQRRGPADRRERGLAGPLERVDQRCAARPGSAPGRSRRRGR